MSELYYSLMDAYKQIALLQDNQKAADEIQEIIDAHIDTDDKQFNESIDETKIPIDYNDIEITIYEPKYKRNRETGEVHSHQITIPFTYYVDRDEIIDYIYEEHFYDIFNEDEDEAYAVSMIDNNLDKYYARYEDEIKEYFRERATEKAEESDDYGEIERAEYDDDFRGFYNEAISPVEQAHQRREKQFTSNAFKTLFQKFFKNGKFARMANWSIGRGGYDLDYEVYFNDIPVVNKMVDEEPTIINHDVLDAINISEEELLNYIKSADGFKYSIEEKVSPAGYAPKKTGKAYKVFRVKNGKLYPPMVANAGGQDTPVGVWLDAEEGEFAGLSKTGRQQVKSIGSGTLSYRPGWHLGDVPRAPQFDRRNKETGEMEFPKDFVWAECDYAMDVDYQKDSDEQGYMRTKVDDKGNVTTYRSDKYQHSLAGLPRLPKDGYYKYRTNPRPDTVPWVITGQMKVNKLLEKW